MSTGHGKLSRRELLRRSVGAAAFAAAGSAWGPLLAAPASRWFNIGASDWSLGKRCDPRAFDVAKTIGLDGVQVEFSHPPEAKPPRSGSPGGISPGRRPHRSGHRLPCVGRAERRAAEERFPRRAMARRGHRRLQDPATGRRHAGLVRPGRDRHAADRRIDHVVRALRQVAPKAEQQGVVIGLENTLTPRTTCGCSIASARRRSRSTTTWATRPTGPRHPQGDPGVGQADLRVPLQGCRLHARPRAHRL